AIRDALDRDDLASRDHGEQRDAAIDGPERALAARVGVDERDRARAAVALRAAVLAAGQADRAQVVEERAVGRLPLDADDLTVEPEFEPAFHGAGKGPTTAEGGLHAEGP